MDRWDKNNDLIESYAWKNSLDKDKNLVLVGEEVRLSPFHKQDGRYYHANVFMDSAGLFIADFDRLATLQEIRKAKLETLNMI